MFIPLAIEAPAGQAPRRTLLMPPQTHGPPGASSSVRGELGGKQPRRSEPWSRQLGQHSLLGSLSQSWGTEKAP